MGCKTQPPPTELRVGDRFVGNGGAVITILEFRGHLVLAERRSESRRDNPPRKILIYRSGLLKNEYGWRLLSRGAA